MEDKPKKKGIMVSHSTVEGEGEHDACIQKKLEGANIKKRRNGLGLEEVEFVKENLSKREIHIYSERSRRRKMAHMFSNVISLLPHPANPKRDRCMILKELICYIKALHNQIEEMGTKKQKLLLRSTEYHQKNQNNNNEAKMEVNMSETDLLITMNATIFSRNRQEREGEEEEEEKGKEKEACKRRISWWRILKALHELELEVVTSTLSTTIDSHFLFVHAKILNMTTFRNKEEIKVVLLQLFL